MESLCDTSHNLLISKLRQLNINSARCKLQNSPLNPLIHRRIKHWTFIMNIYITDLSISSSVYLSGYFIVLGYIQLANTYQKLGQRNKTKQDNGKRNTKVHNCDTKQSQPHWQLFWFYCETARTNYAKAAALPMHWFINSFK